MTFFDEQFHAYLRALSENNNTHWFDENRKWYEDSVKEPFYDFVDEMILQLRSIDPEIRIEPEEAIFRINGDIRYSKEKIPYKTWMCANISVFGKRKKDFPGFFIQADADTLVLAGGVYQPDKEYISEIRKLIVENPDRWYDATDEAFKKQFGGFVTDTYKIIPKEYRDIGAEIPELYNKQFYFRCTLPASLLLMPDCANLIAEIFRPAAKIHHFLKEACLVTVN
ncbi:MAG: DUF2461 domain-containing protein [Bacteroidetes bacterium]|nr:DUF2461 domain-containing protein [Bacteroidota bacterium]